MFIKLSPAWYDDDTSELNDGQVVWKNCHQQIEHSQLANNTYGVTEKIASLKCNYSIHNAGSQVYVQ